MRKKTIKDYYNLTKNKNIVWDDVKIPKHVKIPSWWKCLKCGYRWKAQYNSIQQNHGCPCCVGISRKKEKDYYDLAKKLDLLWIGDKLPKNTETKTLWECLKYHHKFEATYGCVNSSRGFTCPICNGSAAKTECDYFNLVKDRKLTWIDNKLPKDTNTKTLWRWDNGCVFSATYCSIRRGFHLAYNDSVNGVPVSKPQRKLNSVLYGILNYPESKYRIDVAIIRKSQKIAVEYDCCYWHKGNEEYDAKRDKYLIFRGWKIIHIKSRRLLPTRKQIKHLITELLEKDEHVVILYLKDWVS